jgi:hypothetical protein
MPGQNLPGTPAESISTNTSGNVVANTSEIELFQTLMNIFFRHPIKGASNWKDQLAVAE